MSLEVLSAVPTLFAADGSVDLAANRALYVHLAGLVDGLFVAGTTGEFPALSDDERLSLVSIALDVAGPDRVVAHVGAASARQAARLAVAAVGLGVRRIAAITPFYLPARPDELTRHYVLIRDAVGSAAEFYAYIFHERTGVHVPPPLFATVAAAAGLSGAKVSGGSAGALAEYVASAPGLRFFSGDDSNPGRSLALGCSGVVSGRSAAYPEVFATLLRALRDGDGDAASGVSGQSGVPGQPGLLGQEGQSGGAGPLGQSGLSGASGLPGPPGQSGVPGQSGTSALSGALGQSGASELSGQEALDRIVALGASIGRLKHAIMLRGFGTDAARMTVDPPDFTTAAAIAEQVANLPQTTPAPR
ncbi:MAG: dihydrodipicolinate synthase family protein [Streptosporangiaceae bacterium]|nr:dihydrodipicolinate synthase family protein [Streptosporangiaceae bacterium]